MGILKTLLVTFVKSGAEAVINAADFDPAVHRARGAKGAASRQSAPAKKKAAKRSGGTH
jgi:hypothetical protein